MNAGGTRRWLDKINVGLTSTVGLGTGTVGLRSVGLGTVGLGILRRGPNNRINVGLTYKYCWIKVLVLLD